MPVDRAKMRENGTKPQEGASNMLVVARTNARARQEIVDEKRAAQDLFESVSDDGTRWLFVVLPDDGWEITRGGKIIGSGPCDRKSVDAGLLRFLFMTGADIGPRYMKRHGVATDRSS